MTAIRQGRRSAFRNFLLAAGLVAIYVVTASLGAQALSVQEGLSSDTADWQAAAGNKLSFEVSTVKPNSSDDPPKVNFVLGPGDVYADTAGRFLASNISLLDYIRFAYKLTDGQTEMLESAAPKWVATARFDIEARSEIVNPTKDQMRLMMQSLLNERFHLVLRTETRRLPVFALVLAKPGKLGPQLLHHPAEDDSCSNVVTSAGHPSEPESRSVPKVCGGLVSAGVPSAPSHVRITGRKVSLSLLAAHLGEMGQFDRPILDRTDLKGTFDLALEWGPDPASGGDPGDRQINLLEALRDQLGLKLLRQTSSLNVLLIEHVDQQPTEN